MRSSVHKKDSSIEESVTGLSCDLFEEVSIYPGLSGDLPV